MKRPSSAKQSPKKVYVGSQQKNYKAPKYLPNIKNININNYVREDTFEEDLKILQYSWGELGITQEYRSVFMSILEEASDLERNAIITQEKNNLKKFKDALLNLKKEIENRENNLTQLKKADFLIQNAMNDEQNANSINSILQNVISLIKNLRINAVNIVKKVIKVNQITSYYANSGKFNINKIKPEYAYDSRYLFKMKNDLKFLRDSALGAFVEMNNTEIDPFLTNCAPSPNKIKGNKRIIPISDDLMKSIVESRYLLLQETVLDSLEKENNINFRSTDFSEGNLFSKNSRNNLLKRLEEEKFKLGQNKFNNRNFTNNMKIRNNFIHTKGPNISRYIHNMKTGEQSRYNSLFYKKRISPFGSKKKIGTSNSNRIVIMHEEIKSLSNEQFMKRLGNIESQEKENLMKNEALNDTIENLQNENHKLKKVIKQYENKFLENNEKIENLENKNNEIAKRAKEYQNELEQLTQKKKKKENELNNKIDLLQKDIKKVKKDNTKAEDLNNTLKNLENKLKSEESLRQEKEKQVENLENKLKDDIEEKEILIKEKEEHILSINKLQEEKDEIEKNKNICEQDIKRITNEKNMLEEENQKMKDFIKNLEDINKEQDNIIKEKEQIIKEKEEENQKLISEKNIVENEKLSIQNELEKLKEEFEIQRNQLEKLKEDSQNQKNELEKLNEDYKTQKTELDDLREKNQNNEKEKEMEKLKEKERLEAEEKKKREEERMKLEEERKKQEEEERLKKEKEEEEERIRKQKEEEERLKKEEEEERIRKQKEEEEERLKKEKEEEEERIRKEKEEEERLKKEKEEEEERIRKQKEEEERLKKEKEEEEEKIRKQKEEEEERLKKEKEEEERIRKQKEEEEERLKKEKEEEERIRKEKEEEERKKEEEDRLKKEEEERRKKEEEENIIKGLPLLRNTLEYTLEELNEQKEKEKEKLNENKPEIKDEGEQNLPLVNDIINPEKKEDIINDVINNIVEPEKKEDVIQNENLNENNKEIKTDNAEIPDTNQEKKSEKEMIHDNNEIKEDKKVTDTNNIEGKLISLEDQIKYNEDQNLENKEERKEEDNQKNEEEKVQVENEEKEKEKLSNTNEIKEEEKKEEKLPNTDEIVKDEKEKGEEDKHEEIQVGEEKKSEKKEVEEFNDLDISDKKSEKNEDIINEETKKDEENINNNLININYENINPNENVVLKNKNINEELNKENQEKNEEVQEKQEEEKNDDIIIDNIIEVNQEIKDKTDSEIILKQTNLNNENNNLENVIKNEEEKNKENIEEKKEEQNNENPIQEEQKEKKEEEIIIENGESKGEIMEDSDRKKEETNVEEKKEENNLEENNIEEKKEENEIKEDLNKNNEEKKEEEPVVRNLDNNEEENKEEKEDEIIISDIKEEKKEEKEDEIIISDIKEEKKEENNDKKSNEIKPEEEKPKIEDQPQEIQPEEKKEETDLEVISDIQQENKEDKKPKIQEERINENYVKPENKEDNIKEINIEPPAENPVENKEDKNLDKKPEIYIENKEEEEKKENKEEPKIDTNSDNKDDDLDVMSDKQPEIEDKIPENKESKIEEKKDDNLDVPYNSVNVNIPEKVNNSIDNNLKESNIEDVPYNSQDAKVPDNINNNLKENDLDVPDTSTLLNKDNNQENKKEEEKVEQKPENIEKPEEQKQEEQQETPQPSNYKIDYYRENLFNLLTQVSETIPLTSVPDFLKRALAMDESIFSEEFYFKGIFPKILVSRNEKENKITGMLSYYYESNEDLNNNLILRINSILVSQDYEEQIIALINFLKNQVDSDKIMIYILYDKLDENKFKPNSEAKELFEKKLKFKWFCVVRDEKENQRYIKYCFNKKEEEYDVNDENHETTKAVNAIRYNKNNFLMSNLLIASINQEQNSNELKEFFINKINYNKFINIYSIYFLLLQAKNIKLNFKDESMQKEMELMCDKIMKYSICENNYGSLGTSVNKSVKRVEDEMENSIFKEIKEFLEGKRMECVPDLFKTNLFINFETNYSVVNDDVYYNIIASDKIHILEEEKTGLKFFLVPSKDNNVLFYISEVNNSLKNLLIEGTENVYEKFLEFQPSTQKKICDFSVKSVRDVSYIPLISKNKVKTICIPCFSFKTHLFAYDFKAINKNLKLMEKETEAPLNITSVDEFINIEFKPDHNINNSFSTVSGNDLVIENDFIIGIFDNDIINNQKLPLLQFLYVTKDKFLTKTNYKSEADS